MFWFPHQSPAHPASSRRVARIIQLHLMFPPQGRSNKECRGQSESLMLSRLSALGWSRGRSFCSRDSKAQGDQGTVPRAGAELYRAAWLQTDRKDMEGVKTFKMYVCVGCGFPCVCIWRSEDDFGVTLSHSETGFPTKPKARGFC